MMLAGIDFSQKMGNPECWVSLNPQVNCYLYCQQDTWRWGTAGGPYSRRFRHPEQAFADCLSCQADRDLGWLGRDFERMYAKISQVQALEVLALRELHARLRADPQVGPQAATVSSLGFIED